MNTHPATIGFYLSRITSLQKAAVIIDEFARIRLDMVQARRIFNQPASILLETRAWQVWMSAPEPDRQLAVHWLTGTSDNPRIAQ